MNTNQLLYNTAYQILVSMMPLGLSENDLDKYFHGDRNNPTTLKEIYIAFIRTAQNYQFMPNVIQFDNREEIIRNILHDFDYEYVSTLPSNYLYSEFQKVFSITSEKSWHLWCNAVVDSAKFVGRFSSVSEFDKFVTNSSDLKSAPLLISKSIKGIGFALACNALKELGYLDYVKPDVHLIDICDVLNISSRDPIAVFDAMQIIASDNSITPYKLDKVLWLVCSGNFYKDGVKVNGRKEELISKLSESSIKKQRVLRVRKHQKDSNSDLQVRIEKIQIRKLEEKINITDIGNDSYLYFNSDMGSKIKPDIYSSKHHIIGEVYSHLGKLKSSQLDKVTADILKMILFEEDAGVSYKKYYVVCDKAVEESMRGNAVIRNAIKMHDIQIECFELDEPLYSELKQTMIRQDITS